MKTIHPSVKFFINLAKVNTVVSRRLDGPLNGLSLTELIVLLHLSNAHEEKLRRVDLAEKVGLTASGITRLLLPMEKIGLVKRTLNKDDARSTYVALASGGKKKLTEGLLRAEEFCEDLLPAETPELEAASRLLVMLGGSMK